MSKSDAYENDLLKLLFNGTPIPGIADNAASSPLTQLAIALHTGDPGEAGTQTTSECTYGGYARVNVARTSGGFIVTGSVSNPAATISFPAWASGSNNTVTHFSVGATGGGATKIFYSGTVTPNIIVQTGVTPQLGTTTACTED